jgi:hypothetical protein
VFFQQETDRQDDLAALVAISSHPLAAREFFPLGHAPEVETMRQPVLPPARIDFLLYRSIGKMPIRSARYELTQRSLPTSIAPVPAPKTPYTPLLTSSVNFSVVGSIR